MRAASARLSWLTGGDSAVTRRLNQLGVSTTVEQFRLEQLVWAIGGAAAAVVLLVFRGASSDHWLPSAVLIAVAAVTGAIMRDRALSSAVQKRRERMQSELPTIVELLALTVSAGAGLTAALERASRVGSGVVASELQRVLDDVRLGTSLIQSLQHMADRTELTEMRRFVDAVVVAVERGTPLTNVLTAQSGDAREARRRSLIEVGGRKEIAMMVPVVFLVLPISVLFVLFPGFYGLSLSS
jgi:tight adherence protein C